MKARAIGAMVAMMAGMTAVTPAQGVAQKATLQATAVVVEPLQLPTVEVVGGVVDGERRAAVVVTGEQVWRIAVQIEGTEAVMRSGGDGRQWIDLPVEAGEAGLGQQEGTRGTPIRMVVSAI